MSILRRLKNLWRLSEWEVCLPKELYPVGTTISSLYKKKASIVDIEDPLNINLGEI